MTQISLLEQSGAEFSDCGLYRYRLWRWWDATAPSITFLMLNPSTADEHTNDPTVERCIRYARKWGYGGLYVVNLFAWRATDPRELAAPVDPVGPRNDQAIVRAVEQSAGSVLCAWGNGGELDDRGATVVELLTRFELRCLGVNKSGHPVHPLYQPGDAEPVPYPWRELLKRRKD